MKNSQSSFATPIRIVSLVLAPASFGLATPAIAETQAGASISLGGMAATNPFQSSPAQSGVSATAELSPWVRLVDEQSTVEVRGSVRVNQYTEQLGRDVTAAANLNGSHRLSSTASVSGSLGYLTSRAGLHSSLLSRNAAADASIPFTSPLPDVAFGGDRSRTETFNANLGVDFSVSPRDKIGTSFSAARSHYRSALASSHNFFNGGLNYSHSLSDLTSLTASVVVGKSVYSDTRAGDGTIITPQVGIRRRLSTNIEFSASLGASFARTNRGDGTIQSVTSLSGTVRLCRTHEYSAMCLNAARAAQPTAIGGVRTTTTVSVNYDDRVSRRDTIGLTATWTRNDDASLVIGGGPASFYGASASVRREFSRRLSVFVTPSYSKFTNGVRSRNNAQISAGLRFSFGAMS